MIGKIAINSLKKTVLALLTANWLSSRLGQADRSFITPSKSLCPSPNWPMGIKKSLLKTKNHFLSRPKILIFADFQAKSQLYVSKEDGSFVLKYHLNHSSIYLQLTFLLVVCDYMICQSTFILKTSKYRGTSVSWPWGKALGSRKTLSPNWKWLLPSKWKMFVTNLDRVDH